jgi:hypothetical protein
MLNESCPSNLAFSRPVPHVEPQSLGEIEDSGGHTKIELVQLPDDGSGTRLQLVEYSWGSGLGWYARKRLTLDAEQAAGLASMLAAAVAPTRPRDSSKQPAVVRATEHEGNVIRLFPAFEEGA